MKRLFSILIFVLLSHLSAAKIVVSVITTTSGELPHTMFGHTAIRVQNDAEYLDKIYNYGLFNFEEPGFAFKFLGGDLDYWLGRQSLDSFIAMNDREGRVVIEQVLNISDVKAQAIYDDLEFLRREENKYYRYSFTGKNCTSMMRDILIKNRVIAMRGVYEPSKREILLPYVHKAHWYRFGINLLMGPRVDLLEVHKEELFLPDQLMEAVENTPNLVLETNELNVIPEKENSSIYLLWSPLVVFSALALLTFFYSPKWLRGLLFLVTGVMGAFVLYLVLTSYHAEFAFNLNLLWCNPLLLIFPFVARFKALFKFLRLFLIGCMGAVPLAWLFGIQEFDWAVLPIVVMLGLMVYRAERS